MSNFEFKRRLNAPKDNIGKELISSALGRAKKYRRNTAWFRPSALKVWAPVLKDIVEKDIKIEILASLIGNPGSELLVRKVSFNKSKPDYIFILAWQHQKTILKKYSYLKKQGIKFIIPLPSFRVI